MERDPVDIAGLGVATRYRCEAPRPFRSLDPAGQWSPVGEDGIEEGKRLGREVEHRLARGEADRPVAEHRAEGRVAVHDDMAGAAREPRRPALERGQVGLLVVDRQERLAHGHHHGAPAGGLQEPAPRRLRHVKIGLVLPQSTADGAGGTWSEISHLARQAEDGGADSLWLSDHFFYREANAPVGGETGYHEAWTLLSALAAVTRRVELGTLVLATSFRPAGLLAKMAVTADDVAGGRLVLGLGCGWHEPEYEAFGIPFDHRVRRFEEALRIIAPLVRGERVTFLGQYQQVHDAAILPPPIRPRLPILVAATGERMLRLTAELADAWQTAWFGLPDERYRDRHRSFIAACAATGREPGSVEITVGIEIAAESSGPSSLTLDGDAIAAGLTAWAAEGVDHVQLGILPATPDSFGVVLAAIARYRETAR